MNIQAFDVVLIIITIGVFVIGLIAIKKVIREGFIQKWNLVTAVVFGLLFVSYLIYNIVVHKIEPTGWAQIFLTLGLVVVTGMYALVSYRQAKANVKMAEEMREQRYSESLPLLVPNMPPILPSEKLPYESISSGNGVKVKWCNVGKGVAINSLFSFYTAPTSPGRAWFFPPGESVAVEVGGKKEVDYSKMLDEGQLRDVVEGYHPHLLAEYQDIYERKITTVQEFRIAEQNGYKIVSLGDLYFTVNGRRLGEEITP